MSRRGNRAAFLDIDGVLAPFGRPNPAVLDHACVERVCALSSHARIVLVSTWPVDVTCDYGIPIDDALREDERRAPEIDRLRGIWRYLADHPEVRTWVSKDDDPQVDALKRLERRCPGDPVLGLLEKPERFLRTDWTFLWPFDEARGAGLTAGLYDRAVAVLRPELCTAIEQHKAALRAHDRELRVMKVEPGECCETCKYGSRYTNLASRAERCGAALVSLLRKRGAADDEDLAVSVQMGAWP